MLVKEISQAIAALPGEIEVSVESDLLGNLTLTPVDPTVAALVSITNQYDGSSDVYCQTDYDKYYVLAMLELTEEDLPTTTKVGSWFYRHLVGGQSD